MAMDINANVNRLRYFQAVCKYNSVTTAAAELRIAQPSVTIAIKYLEKELNVTLFHRYKNKLILTKEGAIIREMSDQLLNTIHNFFQEVSDIGEKARSKVLLGVPPILGALLIPRVNSAVTQEFPDIQLEVIECGSAQALRYLDQGLLDLAILSEHDFPPDYNYRFFNETEFHFAGSATKARLAIVWSRDRYINSAGRKLIRFFTAHEWS